MMPRYPRVASLVAVSPCRSQVASCWSRFGLLLSVSTSFHYPLQDPPMRCLSPLFLLSPVCGSEFIIIAKALDWPGCLSFSPHQICPWFQSLFRRMPHSPEADLRPKVHLLFFVLFFLLGFTFISCAHSHGEWKDVS